MVVERTFTPGALGLCFILMLAGTDVRSDESYDLQQVEPLLPLVRTYLNLNLCASIAYHYDDNNSLGEVYQGEAVKLLDKAMLRGWSENDFSLAMVVAMEEKGDMEVRDDDTPETFKRRNYSREFCQEKVKQGRVMREDNSGHGPPKDSPTG